MSDREKLIELLDGDAECGGVLGIDSCDTCPYRYNAHCYTLAIVDHLISNGVTVQQWIPVSERLPNYFDHVLINVPGDKPFTTVHEAHLRKDGRWDIGLYRYEREDVTHWMPLPEPPKECE